MKNLKTLILSTLVLISCATKKDLSSNRDLASNQKETYREIYGVNFLETESCYDEDRAYKHCQDQFRELEKSKEKALRNNKKLLIVYGYEKCDWCKRILNVLHDSSISEEVNSKFIIKTITSNDKNQTGKKLMRSLLKREVKNAPIIVIIDPKSDVVGTTFLKEAERNTVNPSLEQDWKMNPWVGYDSLKVKALINQISN